MTLDWPLPILCQRQIWSLRLRCGKSKNYLFHCLILANSNSDFKIRIILFFSEIFRSYNSKVHMKAYGRIWMRFLTNFWVTWPRWPPWLYMLKTLTSSSEPIDRLPWPLVYSIGSSTFTFLGEGQIWENANTRDFMESLEDFGLKW